MPPFLRTPLLPDKSDLTQGSATIHLIDLKVIPNAKRNQIAGTLGQRLKIKVSSPPEAGKANLAVCKLIARQLKIKNTQVVLIAGQSSPEKTVEIRGLTSQEIRHRIGSA